MNNIWSWHRGLRTVEAETHTQTKTYDIVLWEPPGTAVGIQLGTRKGMVPSPQCYSAGCKSWGFPKDGKEGSGTSISTHALCTKAPSPPTFSQASLLPEVSLAPLLLCYLQVSGSAHPNPRKKSPVLSVKAR